MEYKINNKIINIPDDEVQKLITNLELTKEQAISTWLDDNDYTGNEFTEMLTQKAKQNKTTLPHAREKVNNKKTTREHKKNSTKLLIINQIYEKLREIEGISNINIEKPEKIITFTLEDNQYKIDLIQKRKEKI